MSTPLILFILDPPENLIPATDTSLALMREHQRRGHEVFTCAIGDLHLEGSLPKAMVQPAHFPENTHMYQGGTPFDLDLDRCAMVHMRKDPPVDISYLQATYILDRLSPAVLQVNPARALRRHCEKIIPLYFPQLAPPTVVSSAPSEILAFLEKEGKIVIKPLNDCSAHGVFLLSKEDPEAAKRVHKATEGGDQFVIGQSFLPSASDGDMRVLLLRGEVLGCLRRIPKAGDFRSNLNAGGRYEACEMTEAAHQICRRLRPWLVSEEIHLAGVDIMEGKALEVNITSPSCLCEINEVSGRTLETEVIEVLMDLNRRKR